MIATQPDYQEFLETKRLVHQSQGVRVDDSDINSVLFPFQRDVTRFALRKGRAAIFADTGLGKTLMQTEWARLTEQPALIIAPLTVARQTVRLAREQLGVHIQYVRSQSEVSGQLSITNYEMIGEFDPDRFGAVVLDESSILKGLDGKTRKRLTEMFARTPLRLCCTATPAPNDISEIANHSEFLGIMDRANMLATFFVHDDQGWRLKGHAERPFFRWLASWGMSLKRPSNLGYSDDGFELPPLSIEPHFIEVDARPADRLFFDGLKGITDRAAVRTSTLQDRCAAAAEMVNASNEQWIVWCGLNAESDLMHELIPDSVNVEGSQSPDAKADALEQFQDGAVRVLVTKPKIAGFGMNLQSAHKMVFVGLSDSWESYYQCIRRCWRFGQINPVTAHIVLSEAERAIFDNVMHKEQEAKRMTDALIENVEEFEREEIAGQNDEGVYETAESEGAGFKLMLGDSVERLKEIESNTVGLSVFSPPFMSLYTYSPTERDLGNSKSPDEFFSHFNFIIDELLRATMPGRNCCVHVAQVPTTLNTHGVIGLADFRGKVINAYTERGWVYHGEVCIDKDPQAQAIRTHSKGLLFVQLRKDASWLRPALADYILVFRKPGDNPTPIIPDISNDEWIEWARPIWYGIRESETLNTAVAKENQDERHICPLQLGTIERCIRLWSNPGELICSPFAGIGSEGYVALKHDRRFVGIELKRAYWQVAVRNLKTALTQKTQMGLFDSVAG